jgi:hypothetical protein
MSAGVLTLAIAGIHTAVGLVMAKEPVRAIVAAGVVGSIDPHWDRAAAFWFLFFGFAIAIYGDLLRMWEAGPTPVPRRAGFGLAALALAGGIVMPLSGFWLCLIPAGLVISRAPRLVRA